MREHLTKVIRPGPHPAAPGLVLSEPCEGLAARPVGATISYPSLLSLRRQLEAMEHAVVDELAAWLSESASILATRDPHGASAQQASGRLRRSRSNVAAFLTRLQDASMSPALVALPQTLQPLPHIAKRRHGAQAPSTVGGSPEDCLERLETTTNGASRSLKAWTDRARAALRVSLHDVDIDFSYRLCALEQSVERVDALLASGTLANLRCSLPQALTRRADIRRPGRRATVIGIVDAIECQTSFGQIPSSQRSSAAVHSSAFAL